VHLNSPDLQWEGNAYLDSNEGDEPISQAFHEWDWSRAEMSGNRTSVIYDVREKNAQENVLALTFNPNATNIGIWDTSKWDQSYWGGVYLISKDWESVTGIGYAGGLLLQTASQGIDVHWTSTDFVMEVGSVI
jgi:hypothetical protein